MSDPNLSDFDEKRIPDNISREKAWITFFDEKENEDGGNLADRE